MNFDTEKVSPLNIDDFEAIKSALVKAANILATTARRTSDIDANLEEVSTALQGLNNAFTTLLSQSKIIQETHQQQLEKQDAVLIQILQILKDRMPKEEDVY